MIEKETEPRVNMSVGFRFGLDENPDKIEEKLLAVSEFLESHGGQFTMHGPRKREKYIV